MTYPKDKLIPAMVRKQIAEGEPPLYRLNRPDYDRVPLDTFLVASVTGTLGRAPSLLARVVKPNNPRAYQSDKLTPEKRLLYVCWARGEACKRLLPATSNTFRHVVYPSDPEHHMIEMFKIACDTRRAWSKDGAVETKPTLLYQALGLDIEYYAKFKDW